MMTTVWDKNKRRYVPYWETSEYKRNQDEEDRKRRKEQDMINKEMRRINGPDCDPNGFSTY